MTLGLYPPPENTIIELWNPFDKTIQFVRYTAEGQKPCAPPKGYKLQAGYRIKEAAVK